MMSSTIEILPGFVVINGAKTGHTFAVDRSTGRAWWSHEVWGVLDTEGRHYCAPGQPDDCPVGEDDWEEIAFDDPRITDEFRAVVRAFAEQKNSEAQEWLKSERARLGE